MDFPISKIINVSLLTTPLGLSDLNVNTIALFTLDAANGSFGTDGYKIYTSPDAVATDFGSTSETYLQAVAVFSQSPNILSGGGYLVVVTLGTNANATAGKMTTEAIGGTLAQFVAITDGAYKVTVDGTLKTVTACDFHEATSLDDIATELESATGASGFTVEYDATANSGLGGFVFTSATTGAASKVTKLSAPSTGTDISGSNLLNGVGNPMIVDGTAAAGRENLVTAIQRTKNDVYYTGVIHAGTLALADALNIASYMQTQDKLFFLGRDDDAEIDTLFALIKAAGLTHTRTFLYQVSAQAARLAVAAYASRLMGINFDGSQTMCTMNLKSLAGVTPDPDSATDAIDLDAQAYGFDIYVSVGGDPVVLSYGANGYSDDIYGALWLKLAIQIAGYNYLKTTNTKIPQTEPGMDGLKGAYAKICEQAITNNLAARGLTWTSASTFGNTEDFKRNIIDMGYYIYSQPISQQSQADRAARKAPLIQIACKFSGAIHHSDVTINVN